VVTLGGVHPKHVAVPGPLVEYVVAARRGTEAEKFHWQTASFDLPIISGDAPYRAGYKPLPLGLEMAVARRVVLELLRVVEEVGRPIVINLGVGIPAAVADVVREEGLDDVMHMTVESGPWEASMQVDELGNVNSAFAPGRITGPTGFSIIATGSPRVYFAGAFTAGKRDIRVDNCRLAIVQDGPIVKFVKRVFKIVFNAGHALKEGKVVMYITERAVFKLTPTGVELVEVARASTWRKTWLRKGVCV